MNKLPNHVFRGDIGGQFPSLIRFDQYMFETLGFQPQRLFLHNKSHLQIEKK